MARIIHRIRIDSWYNVDGSIVITSALLVLFNLMIAQAILRGFNIECGCGLKEGQLVGIEKILENFVFLALNNCAIELLRMFIKNNQAKLIYGNNYLTLRYTTQFLNYNLIF